MNVSVNFSISFYALKNFIRKRLLKIEEIRTSTYCKIYPVSYKLLISQSERKFQV